jgi:tetratricopeptide (TPR) repeat protein
MKQYSFLILFFLTVFNAYSQKTAEEYYKDGLKLKDEKKMSEAIAAFKKAVELKPNYGIAIYETGWCYNELKEYSIATSFLRKARSYIPDVPKVYYELGYAFEKSENYDSAIVTYNNCLKLKPDYSGAFKRLGYIYYEKDNYIETIAQFLKYELNAKTPITDYLYWHRKGFSYNAIKEYENAKTNLKKSLEFKTDYINTYLELGFAETKLKNNDAAIEWFKKAMAIDPKSHIPYNGIAEVYRDNLKDMNEAMNWYKKTLSVKANERKACFGMGYCLNSLSKYSEAIPYLKQAIASEDTYAGCLCGTGLQSF